MLGGSACTLYQLHRSTQKLIECFVTDLPGDADIVICWPTLKADSTLKSILFAQLVEVGNIDWIQALVAKARAGKQDWLDTKASDGTAHGLHDFDPGPSTVKQERYNGLVSTVTAENVQTDNVLRGMLALADNKVECA